MQELKQQIFNAVTCFYTEYKKLIHCAILIGVLFLVQAIFKTDLSSTIDDLIDYLKIALVGLAGSYKVLKTSERQKIESLPPAPQLPVDEFKGTEIKLELSGEGLHMSHMSKSDADKIYLRKEPNENNTDLVEDNIKADEVIDMRKPMSLAERQKLRAAKNRQ